MFWLRYSLPTVILQSLTSILSTLFPHFFFCILSIPFSIFFFTVVTCHTITVPVFTSSSSPYLAPCSPNPPVQALSWIKLSPILSLYGRIYSSTPSYPPFSTLTVGSTVLGPCSLESIKFSCTTEGNPRRTLKVSEKHHLANI